MKKDDQREKSFFKRHRHIPYIYNSGLQNREDITVIRHLIKRLLG